MILLYTRHKRAVAWPQGCLLVGLKAALGDLNHMNLTGKWSGRKILLDAETESTEEAFGLAVKSFCLRTNTLYV